MIKSILLSSLFLAVICFDSQGQNVYHNLSERELIELLKNPESSIRYDAAGEIKNRLMTNKNAIKVGNIVEHTEEFWQTKVAKFQHMEDMSDLTSSFGIDVPNYVPNYKNTKAFRLDHHYVIYVEMNKKRTKGKVLHLVKSTEFYSIDAPSDYTGLWKVYRISGNLHSETSYVDGQLDGVQTIYRVDGSTNWSKLYMKGEIQFQRGYSPIGEMTSERIFDDIEREKYRKEREYERNFQNN